MDTMRERILQVGRGMLVEGRLGHVTTSAIAERARISKKTLYKTFSNQDELVNAIVLDLVEEVLGRWDGILSREGRAIGQVLDLLGLIAETLPRIQTTVIDSLREVPPELWKRIDAARMRRVRGLVQLVAQAQREGDVRPDVDPDVWALLLLETVRHVLTPKTLYETGYALPQLMEAVRLVYFDGLLTEAGRAHAKRRGRERR
jgi:AcrR family transcriptional regulator